MNYRDSGPPAGHDDTLHGALQDKFASRQVKRAAKATERREKSEALREEGNGFFRKGDYESAVDRYQHAIRVHGPSVKPVLLTNLATAYHKLGKFVEAHEAADKALFADPKSVKARYRRAMARKEMESYAAAAIDLDVVLRLDPRYYQDIEKELAYIEERRCENWFMEEDSRGMESEDEFPAPDDDPDAGESLSESSDCEHSGNGKPCKWYNHDGCTKGRGCRFSHAPDHLSRRDAIGRNVCKYFLMDVCKFGGEKCAYSHSKEYLLQKGWWSTPEGIDGERRLYNVQQTFKKAAIDYEKQNKTPIGSEKRPPAKKKRSGRNKKRARRTRLDTGGLTSGVVAADETRAIHTSSWSSRTATLENRKERRATFLPSPEVYDSDGGNEYGMFGFTDSEVEELLCHGVKPWDDDAWDFLDALHDAYI